MQHREKTIVKIPALAALAAVMVAASPAFAHRRHNAVAHRGHNSAVVVDPDGLHALGLALRYPPRAVSYDPALNGSHKPALNVGGSAGYNAGLAPD
jgi:hypothetical protein